MSALLVVACAAGALPSHARQASHTSRKPNRTQLHQGHSREIVHLKFREGTGIRLRQGRFAGRDEQAQALAALLRRYPGVRIERLFARSEQTLDQQRQRVERKSGRALPDKNLFYRLRLRAGSDAERLIDDLNALEFVELAYPASRAMPPPTPSFFEDQGYLRPASESGIDADVAARVCGGRGSAVTVIDIEYDWNQSHEDLSKAAGALIPNGTPVSPFGDNNHGTAVLGELIADDNGFGVTGIVPDAGLGLVNASNDEDGYDLADAIDTAHAALSPGDVILIEQQVAGPNGCDNDTQFGCVAVEWDLAYWTAIVSATADGIIVVEAAGNGMQDLDDSGLYGSPFPDGRADSGAIIVGAGAAAGCTNPERSRLNFSTFGSRVNLQGWGECVTTTGYGGLQGGSDPNLWYTSSFGGTSSASPIVAGAAASLSSVAETLAGVHLTSAEVRSLLESTGTPQDPGSAHIGPLPNLRAALATYEVVAPTLSCPSQVTAECTSPAGAAVSFNVTATDDCDPTPGVACDLPTGHTFALGTTPNSCDAEDAVGNDSSCAFDVIVEDTTDPLVNCPANVVVECTGNNGISASDPQLAGFFAGASASDVCDAAPVLSHNAPAFFGLGPTNVTFTATDASGNSSACVATVTVADTTPPTIDMSVNPTFLWPPNHSLRPITATVAVADICDPSPFYALTSITSNEPDNGLGDGDQPNDIQDAAYGNPDLAFSLRAERGGVAVGRIYSVIYTASDHSGNTTPAGANVTVAHP